MEAQTDGTGSINMTGTAGFEVASQELTGRFGGEGALAFSRSRTTAASCSRAARRAAAAASSALAALRASASWISLRLGALCWVSVPAQGATEGA